MWSPTFSTTDYVPHLRTGRFLPWMTCLICGARHFFRQMTCLSYGARRFLRRRTCLIYGTRRFCMGDYVPHLWSEAFVTRNYEPLKSARKPDPNAGCARKSTSRPTNRQKPDPGPGNARRPNPAQAATGCQTHAQEAPGGNIHAQEAPGRQMQAWPGRFLRVMTCLIKRAKCPFRVMTCLFYGA